MNASLVVRRFEAAAAALGCVLVILETFVFQAPGSDRGLGDVQVHWMAQFSHGIEKLWFERALAAPG